MTFPKITLSPVPASIFKKKPTNKLHVQQFDYLIYQCRYTLRVKPADEKDGVDILHSCFQEATNGGYLIVMVCSNATLLFHLKEEDGNVTTKQLNWFQNPSKEVIGMCIDPLRSTWVVCVCRDNSIYLIPVLAHLKDLSLAANSNWSKTDLSQIHYSKPIKGEATCIVWWHTLDDRNVAIIGSNSGELIFVDLALHQEICRTIVKEKVENMKLLHNINEGSKHLLLYSSRKWTLQLLLERPSPQGQPVVNPSSSLSQAFDLGYDMVSECNVESILDPEVISHHKDSDINIQKRLEALPQDFGYSLHEVRERTYICKHDTRHDTLEVFSNIRQTPQFVYQLPSNLVRFSLCNNLIMCIHSDKEKVQLKLLARQFAAFGRNTKKEEANEAYIQTLQLLDNEQVLGCYTYQYTPPPAWKTLFPLSAGYAEKTHLSAFLLITKDGIMECKPRTSAENYFTELATQHGTEYSERLGTAFNLNLPLLYEYIADKSLKDKDLQRAINFYNLSKCPPIKRAAQLINHASVTDGLIFIKQILKKQPSNLTSARRKKLSDIAVLCYTEQGMQSHHMGNFFRNLSESFRSFLCDNFDYDDMAAMDVLLQHGFYELMFDVAKARGKVDVALDKLAESGFFLLLPSIQTMLLDSGYAPLVCQTKQGIFMKHMGPDDAARFLLAQSTVTKQFVSLISNLLLDLSETSLLQIARMFDPSRQFIKPILERCESNFKTSRSPSSLSENSTSEEFTVSDIITLFIKAMIALNCKRKESKLPDLSLISRNLSGQLSWTNSLLRSESVSSNELLISEVARARIACGRNHIAYITADKQLYTWGKAAGGRLGSGDLVDERGTCEPFRVENLHMHGIQVKSVACGAQHTVVLCEEGVFAWGSNKFGQLGIGDTRMRSRPVLITHICLISSIVCGSFHTLAVTTNYKLYAWGWGVHGQLGLHSVENQLIPKPVLLLDGHRIVQAAAGYAHSAVLTSQRLVFTFGAGSYGQLGIGVNTKCVVPQLVDTLVADSIYLIACGAFETLAVSDEQAIFCWGRNHHQFYICGKAESSSYGRKMASNVDLSHRYYPEDLPFKLQQPITQLICGYWHYMAVTASNYVYTWGYNDCGQLGHYNKIDQPAPRLVKALSRNTVVAIDAGTEFSVAVTSEDHVFAWGRNDGGMLGIENEAVVTSPVSRRTIFSILAPTLVPGLPAPSDQTSISSSHSLRNSIFDQNSLNLPDLSVIGNKHVPYSLEAVLICLYKLIDLFNATTVQRFAEVTGQWFVLSYCHQFQQRWLEAFTYREKAICRFYLDDDNADLVSYSEQMYLVVSDLLRHLEDCIAENYEEGINLVSMVICLKEMLNTWLKEDLSLSRLEEVLLKYLEVMAPIYTIVIFGHLRKSLPKSSSFRFALHQTQTKHPVAEKLSCHFYTRLLTQVMQHMATGTNWYDYLTTDVIITSSAEPMEDGSSSYDQMLREVVEHKRKVLNAKPYINLSNAVTTTLAAAAKVHRSDHQEDVVVFTCLHNLLHHYMSEVVIPEFETRMASLPAPLPHTARVLTRVYESDTRMPLACPYCVFNSFRLQQMHMLHENGIESNFSSVWEI